MADLELTGAPEGLLLFAVFSVRGLAAETGAVAGSAAAAIALAILAVTFVSAFGLWWGIAAVALGVSTRWLRARSAH
jgi:hypothetical protein